MILSKYTLDIYMQVGDDSQREALAKLGGHRGLQVCKLVGTKWGQNQDFDGV
jgi:hypothetical protein